MGRLGETIVVKLVPDRIIFRTAVRVTTDFTGILFATRNVLPWAYIFGSVSKTFVLNPCTEECSYFGWVLI